MAAIDLNASSGGGLNMLMFAVSSSRHKNALLARERFRMAATEQGRRHNHQNDG
jgi:hypothetical protein